MDENGKKLTLKLKKRWAKQPADIIKGVDPVSVSLLRQMYAGLKDRGDNLGLYEKAWVRQIETIYSDKTTYNSFFINGLETLLRQGLKVLGDDPEKWDVEEKELYGTFHKLIFLKLREGDLIFKTFFDDVEATLMASLQGDFTKRVALTKIGNNQENVFTYAAVMVNTLMDSLQSSAVSVSALNDILEQVPGAVVIITDLKGKIKFVNRLGARLFSETKTDLIGSQINSLTEIKLPAGVKTTSYMEADLKLKEDKIEGKASVYIMPGGGEAKVTEITYFIDISRCNSIHEKINPQKIVEEFFKNSLIPQKDDVKHIIEVYSFSYSGDKSIFTQLMNMLLENAVTDTRKGKANVVKVHFAEVHPERYVLRVSSSGWGYKANQLHRIFENELSTVKEYCDKLSARVEIQSQYLKDTVITVHLTSRRQRDFIS